MYPCQTSGSIVLPNFALFITFLKFLTPREQCSVDSRSISIDHPRFLYHYRFLKSMICIICYVWIAATPNATFRVPICWREQFCDSCWHYPTRWRVFPGHVCIRFQASLVFSSNFLSTYQYFQIKSAKFVMNYIQLTFFFWHFWKKISWFNVAILIRSQELRWKN